MRLSPVEVEKIAKTIIKHLKSVNYAVKDEVTAINIIENVLNESMEAEKALEKDALRLFDQHKKALGASVDHDKATRMIMEKLAKERGFVL